MEPKFFLMTDSPCDFSQEMVDEMGIGLIRFSYAEADKPDGGLHGTDDLFETSSAHEFYDAIRKGAHPLTSQPSQLEFEEHFRRCLELDVPTVYLCFDSALSGAYEGACLALARMEEEAGERLPIHIVDAKLASTGQYLLVVEAVRQRDRGLTAEEMVAWAEEVRYFVHTYFMVDDLECLHRGGRLPKSVAVVGGALDVKPILAFDLEGALTVVGLARGRKKGIRKLAANFESGHNRDDFSNVAAIGNADCRKDADRLVDMVRKTDDSTIAMVSTIGPIIGCHVGPGMVSCCFWGDDRRRGMSVSDRIAASVRKS